MIHAHINKYFQALLQMKFFTIIPATLTEKLNPDHFVYNLEGGSPITSQKTSTVSFTVVCLLFRLNFSIF